MRVKLAGRSALVQIAPSSQEITAHAGLVLVRELTSVLGVAELLDQMTVKKRARGYSPAQQALALCETLIAGGECLDDAALLRADGAQEQLRGHAIPDPTTLGRFLASFNLGHIRQFERALEQLFARVHPLLERETVTLDLDATLVETDIATIYMMLGAVIESTHTTEPDAWRRYLGIVLDGLRTRRNAPTDLTPAAPGQPEVDAAPGTITRRPPTSRSPD